MKKGFSGTPFRFAVVAAVFYNMPMFVALAIGPDDMAGFRVLGAKTGFCLFKSNDLLRFVL